MIGEEREYHTLSLFDSEKMKIVARTEKKIKFIG